MENQEEVAIDKLKNSLDKFTFTEKDKELLLSIDPQVSYQVNEHTKYTEGRQSKVIAIDAVVEGGSVPLIIKQMGYRKGLTKDESFKALTLIPEYRRILIENGFNLSDIYYLDSREIDGEYRIVGLEKRIDLVDGDKMVRDINIPRFVKYHLIENVVYTICGAKCTDSSDCFLKLPYSLDLKLANFVVDFEDLKVYFVDVFGPKNIDENGKFKFYSTKLDGLSEESLMSVTGTRVGVILRFYRLLEISWDKAEADILGELRRYFSSLLERVGLTDKEKEFIISEINNNYPWLDSVYEEIKV